MSRMDTPRPGSHGDDKDGIDAAFAGIIANWDQVADQNPPHAGIFRSSGQLRAGRGTRYRRAPPHNSARSFRFTSRPSSRVANIHPCRRGRRRVHPPEPGKSFPFPQPNLVGRGAGNGRGAADADRSCRVRSGCASVSVLACRGWHVCGLRSHGFSASRPSRP